MADETDDGNRRTHKWVIRKLIIMEICSIYNTYSAKHPCRGYSILYGTL